MGIFVELFFGTIRDLSNGMLASELFGDGQLCSELLSAQIPESLSLQLSPKQKMSIAAER